MVEDTIPDDRPWQDRDVLMRLYHGEDLTTREIADRLGCTNGTVSRWLDNHDIQTRENWKAGSKAGAEASRVPRAYFDTLESGYEFWSVRGARSEDVSSNIVYVHRLLAIAEYGFDAVSGMDVHHQNSIPWDNRAENIELMTKANHTRYHNKKRPNNTQNDD